MRHLSKPSDDLGVQRRVPQASIYAPVMGSHQYIRDGILPAEIMRNASDSEAGKLIDRLAAQEAFEYISDLFSRKEYQGPDETANKLAARWKGLPEDAFEREQALTRWFEQDKGKFNSYLRLWDEANKAVYEAFAKDIRMGGRSVQKSVLEADKEYERLKPNFYDKFSRAVSTHKTLIGGVVASTIALGAAISVGTKLASHPAESQPTPARDYAHSLGMSDTVAEMVGHAFDADHKMSDYEKSFIDRLSHFESQYQEKIAGSFLSDGVLTDSEYKQVQFLGSIPKADQVKEFDSGAFANPDQDGDGMSSYFEFNINHTPYDHYNGRYAIILRTDPNASSGSTLASYLIDQQGFEPENVIKLLGNNGTKDNFTQAISEISHKANADDLVYIAFDGHGGTGAFCFNDGKGNIQAMSRDNGLLWTEIKDLLEPLKAGKMLITTYSCGGADSIEPLSGPNRVVADMPQLWVVNSSGVYEPVDKSPEAKLFDLDGNGYVSFAEIYKIFCEYQTGARPDLVKMSDESGIAPDLYLGDFQVR